MTEAGFGKYAGTPIVVRTSEVEPPIEHLARRMRALGATDEMIAEARDATERGRLMIHHATDGDLAAMIAARLTGTEVSWVRADLDAIAAARSSTDLWIEAREIVGTGPKGNAIPRVMAWVGANAGRAVVAHEAEAERAADAGVDPRRTLVGWLRAIHGQPDVGLPLGGAQ